MFFVGYQGAGIEPADLAKFAGGSEDFSDFPGGYGAVNNALASAMAFVNGYTGLSLDLTTVVNYPDIAHAVLTIGAEMLDNKQLTAEYTGQNPMVMQILNMHSTNLLPSVPKETEATG